MLRMTKIVCIQCRVDEPTKASFKELADDEGVSESDLLRRMVIAATSARRTTRPVDAITPVASIGKAVQMGVRLRGDDALLLRERAAARDIAPASYVSLLVRRHLRSVPPLPDRELGALLRAIASVNELGRNLNQIARAANQGSPIQGLDTAALRSILRVMEPLRDPFKGLLAANLKSWEVGYEEPRR